MLETKHLKIFRNVETSRSLLKKAIVDSFKMTSSSKNPQDEIQNRRIGQNLLVATPFAKKVTLPFENCHGPSSSSSFAVLLSRKSPSFFKSWRFPLHAEMLLHSRKCEKDFRTRSKRGDASFSRLPHRGMMHCVAIEIESQQRLAETPIWMKRPIQEC